MEEMRSSRELVQVIDELDHWLPSEARWDDYIDEHRRKVLPAPMRAPTISLRSSKLASSGSHAPECRREAPIEVPVLDRFVVQKSAAVVVEARLDSRLPKACKNRPVIESFAFILSKLFFSTVLPIAINHIRISQLISESCKSHVNRTNLVLHLDHSTAEKCAVLRGVSWSVDLQRDTTHDVRHLQ